MESAGTPLPEETLASVKANGVALKGPITTRSARASDPQRRPAARARAVCLFRPCKSYAGVRSRYEEVDLVVVRENTETSTPGSSTRRERGREDGHRHAERAPGEADRPPVGISVKPISAAASERIIRFAFEYAREHGRREVAGVTKANIMKFTDGLFLAVFREVAADYPDVTRARCSSTRSRCSSSSGPRSSTSSCSPISTATSSAISPQGSWAGSGSRPGECRRAGGRLRGDTRLGPEVHGPEQGQSDGDDPLRQAHARAPWRARRGAAPRIRGRSRDRGRRARDLRPQADARRPDRGRHLRLRRRDHRKAGT